MQFHLLRGCQLSWRVLWSTRQLWYLDPATDGRDSIQRKEQHCWSLFQLLLSGRSQSPKSTRSFQYTLKCQSLTNSIILKAPFTVLRPLTLKPILSWRKFTEDWNGKYSNHCPDVITLIYGHSYESSHFISYKYQCYKFLTFSFSLKNNINLYLWAILLSRDILVWKAVCWN